jgi:hypothetical protein
MSQVRSGRSRNELLPRITADRPGRIALRGQLTLAVTRRHQDHQPVNFAALHALQVSRYKTMVGGGAIAWVSILGEADDPLALLLELVDASEVALEGLFLITSKDTQREDLRG